MLARVRLQRLSGTERDYAALLTGAFRDLGLLITARGEDEQGRRPQGESGRWEGIGVDLRTLLTGCSIGTTGTGAECECECGFGLGLGLGPEAVAVFAGGEACAAAHDGAEVGGGAEAGVAGDDVEAFLAAFDQARSEERRVGKECSS